jgi:phosphoglycerate dehydrogenase-like enzyme
LLHRADGKTEPWIKDFAKYLPEAEIEIWHAGEKCQACDYAVVWSPPEAMLAELATVKAIFVTGAGVDALLKFGDALPPTSPSSAWKTRAWRCRWRNTSRHSVLRYFRRFDEYEAQARAGLAAAAAQGRFRRRRAGHGRAGHPRAGSAGAVRLPAARLEPHRNRCRACKPSPAPMDWTPSCAARACWSACCR